jgi:hypothetical protein
MEPEARWEARVQKKLAMRITKDPIEPALAKELVKWVSHPLSDTFIELVKSDAFECECRAATHLAAGTEAGNREAAADIEESRKLRYVVATLKKYQSEKQFKRASATPD